MAEPLRILILEDNPTDAELVQFELQEAGIVFAAIVVTTEKDFIREIQGFCPDLILSDYDLPAYNGALALAETRRRCPDTPFILVTGAVSEDRAIEILTQGAKDYVLKTRLQQRLVPAVQRALAEAEEHRARKQAEEELREAHRTLEKQVKEAISELQKSKEHLSLALSSSRMGTFEWDIVANKRSFDDYTYLLLGIKPDNFTGTTDEFFEVIHPDDRQAVQTALNKAIEQDVPYETEYRAIWPDGSVHNIATRGKVQRDDVGHSLRIIGVCWEITERRRAEERLRRQAELINLASEAILMWEFDGAIIYWSDGAKGLYGYSREEAAGRVSHDLLKTGHPLGVDHFKTMLTRHGAWAGELSHITKDDRSITVESRQQLIRDDLGRPIVLETNRDITKRKRVEEALQDSEKRYRRLFESSKDGVLILDADTGKVVDVNPFLLQLLGYSYDEVYGKYIWELGVFKDIAASKDAFKALQDTEYIRYEDLPLETRNGQSIAVEFVSNVYLVDHTKVVQCNIRDVTERKQAGEQIRISMENLRLNEERLQLTLAAARMASWDWHVPSGDVVWNEMHYRMMGYEPGEVQPSYQAWASRVHPDDIDAAQSEIQKCMGERRVYTSEFRTLWPDGTIRHLEERGEFEYDANNQPLRFYGVMLDITERKQMETVQAFLAQTSVGQSDEPFFNALARYIGENLSMDYVCIDRLEGDGLTARTVAVWNDGYFEDNVTYALKDTPCGAVVGKTVCCFPTAVCKLFPHDEALQDLKADSYVGVTLFGHTGKPIGLIAVIGRSPLDNQTLAENVLKMVAIRAAGEMERLDSENALKEQAQQLEAANKELESFSYSVSHDLRAPLRAIDGYSRMLLKKHSEALSEDATRMLGVIRSNTERMGVLIDDLLSFSRVLKSDMAVSEIDMGKLVNEACDGIRAVYQERELEFRMTEMLPVFGDRNLIRQVLFNLFSNAIKFTKNRTPGIIELSCYIEDQNITYCLKDNGVGFDMAYYEKLFGVFQRLHGPEEYEGTGAGLAIVQRIIKRHGGNVWAEGEVDKGATFYFSLPINQ